MTLVALGLAVAGGGWSVRGDEPPAPSTREQTVTSTVKGLETLKLMEKGIVAEDSSLELSPSQLLSNVSLDQPDTPLQPASAERAEQGENESDARKLRRRQWAAENWLVNGMRRTAIAGDEAALTAEVFGVADDDGTQKDGPPQADSLQHWLALAIESQAEGDAMSDNARSDANADAASEQPRTAARAEANPLGNFMADWLSPDSQRLLQADQSAADPGDGPLAPLGGNVSGSSATTVGNQSDWLAAVAPITNAKSGRGPAGEGGARENPFLADWESFALAAPGSSSTTVFPAPGADGSRGSPTGFQPIVPEAGVGPRPAPSALAPPTDTSAEKASESWQPPASDSEKYFPRLKRF